MARIFLSVGVQDFSDLGSGDGKKEKKNLENVQLTCHFQSLFFISRKNSRAIKVSQQSALNLYIFHHFPKNLDRTITYHTVTLKNTQTEPQKTFSTKQIKIKSWWLNRKII